MALKCLVAINTDKEAPILKLQIIVSQKICTVSYLLGGSTGKAAVKGMSKMEISGNYTGRCGIFKSVTAPDRVFGDGLNMITHDEMPDFGTHAPDIAGGSIKYRGSVKVMRYAYELHSGDSAWSRNRYPVAQCRFMVEFYSVRKK